MSDMPELRAGPPWAMEEMIYAEAGLVGPILASSAALEAAESIREGGPVVIVGCGTSEHAAMAGAALIRGAIARDAFEASLDPQHGGVIVGVSHEAGTRATLAALAAAAANGADPVLVTARPGAAPSGPLVVPTPVLDRSWCHTVGYLSPLLAFHAMAGPAPEAAAGAVARGLARRSQLEEAAGQVAGCRRLLVVGSGCDEITARELALKIEEGTHVPVTPLGTEKVLHGHLPAADAGTGIVLLRFDERKSNARDVRAHNVEAAAAALDAPSVTLRGAAEGLPPAAGALIAGALALQLFTLGLVTALGTNPDLIRREEPAYRAAAEAAGAG
jgi:glutamine---fructose-6-phosphate transaminase (isomerizing)